VALMYLADTNIFLEILLRQEKSDVCKSFLKENLADICLSDFSLHSLGVVTFRQGKPGLFMEFAQDMLPHLQLLSLPTSDYIQLPVSSGELKLDFDDVYQYRLAKAYNLTLVTLDRDFRFVSDIQVYFL
jgi:uncharacterized protein